MAKIVVLGAGLGGVIAAYEIRKSVRPEDDVVVINENPFYQFVPSNPWVLVGWRDRQDIFDRFVENPGPIVVGAVQGASCFGPAYEFAMILDTELRAARSATRCR
jgi:NADPH-dependent 2,4-dienoyl-CoA reductase/sulfur reductase-like enzyme